MQQKNVYRFLKDDMYVIKRVEAIRNKELETCFTSTACIKSQKLVYYQMQLQDFKENQEIP